ncbi:hypothetical protein MPSEU_001043500 [Mayamaea pseudoterrestris]|nr:hypothetical protein MPSEU_001043500 [Mayamaea pseudoterrestris]
MSEANSSQAESCPICLEECNGQNDPQKRLLAPPCGHAACRSCFEQSLLKHSRPMHVTPSNQHSRDLIGVPTLGLCSICRAKVYLFDLVDCETKEVPFKKVSAFPLPNDLVNAVFSKPEDGMDRGCGNWCFGKGVDDGKGNGIEREAIYYDLSQGDERGLPESHLKMTLPVQAAHFHASSRTLAGHMVYPSGYQYEKTNIYLSFSADYSYIRSGMYHHVPARFNSPEHFRRHYPLDGLWESIGTTRSVIVVVKGMVASFDDGTPDFLLKMYREENAIECIDANGEPLFRSSFDWTGKPMGPNVGEFIVWNFIDYHQLPHRRWVRKTVDVSEVPNVVVYIGRGLLYRRISNELREPPTYKSDSVWGNVFCQNFTVGLASYHFISPGDGVYISYEHPAAADWPPLDNGAPIPCRVPFRNIQVNGTSFRGSITWQQDYGTTWQGSAEWTYRIEFDREFTCILSGEVHSRGPHVMSMPEEMSRYGESLVYINAALDKAIEHLGKESSISLPKRLLEQGGSARTTVNDVRHILAAVHTGFPPVIDLNM